MDFITSLPGFLCIIPYRPCSCATSRTPERFKKRIFIALDSESSLFLVLSSIQYGVLVSLFLCLIFDSYQFILLFFLVSSHFLIIFIYISCTLHRKITSFIPSRVLVLRTTSVPSSRSRISSRHLRESSRPSSYPSNPVFLTRDHRTSVLDRQKPDRSISALHAYRPRRVLCLFCFGHGQRCVSASFWSPPRGVSSSVLQHSPTSFPYPSTTRP